MISISPAAPLHPHRLPSHSCQASVVQPMASARCLMSAISSSPFITASLALPGITYGFVASVWAVAAFVGIVLFDCSTFRLFNHVLSTITARISSTNFWYPPIPAGSFPSGFSGGVQPFSIAFRCQFSSDWWLFWSYILHSLFVIIHHCAIRVIGVGLFLDKLSKFFDK